MNKLDHQRLRECISQAKTDATTSRSQLINLTRRVSEAKLTEPVNVPANVVTMNSQVSVTNLDSGQTFTLRLAYPELADPGQQQISILAPLATALLGNREGEVVSLTTHLRDSWHEAIHPRLTALFRKQTAVINWLRRTVRRTKPLTNQTIAG